MAAHGLCPWMCLDDLVIVMYLAQRGLARSQASNHLLSDMSERENKQVTQSLSIGGRAPAGDLMDPCGLLVRLDRLPRRGDPSDDSGLGISIRAGLAMHTSN